jgi:hypothetical protein
MKNKAYGLMRAGELLEIGAIIYAVASVIGAIAIAGTSSTDGLGSTTHPYVALGLVAGMVSLMTALAVWAFGRICRIYAADHGVVERTSSVVVPAVADGTY